jgi:hypothetical protein
MILKGFSMIARLSHRRVFGAAGYGFVGLLGLVALLFLAETATAGSAKIGGVRMSCHAANVVISNDVPGPGFALPGTILFGPQYLKKYPPIVQRLIFLHECAHQYVGADEVAADCWAVRIAKRQGWLTQSGVKSTCRAIWHTSGGYTHPDGPERCAKLTACFAEAPTRKGAKLARKKK